MSRPSAGRQLAPGARSWSFRHATMLAPSRPWCKPCAKPGWAVPLVIDNRSADGTCLFAQEAGARVLRPLIPMSRWGAIQTGMRLALAEGHRGILTVFANQRPAPRLWQELLEQAPHADAAVLRAPGNGAPWWQRVLQTSTVPAHPAYYSRAAMESFTSTEAALLDDAELGLLWLTRYAGMRIVRIDPAAHAPEPMAPPEAPNHPWWSGIRRLAATALFRLPRQPRPPAASHGTLRLAALTPPRVPACAAGSGPC